MSHRYLKLSLLLALSTGALAAESAFQLSSQTVKPGSTLSMEQVFHGMGCTGKNVSPELHWSGAPSGTKSYALTVYDPDAPTGSGWWHWVVYNIPAAANSLPQHAGDADGKLLPAGAMQGRTDFGSAGFGGPCPPVGDKPHRYIFTLYALKTEKIEASANSSPAMIGFMINANKLGAARITARFGR